MYAFFFPVFLYFFFLECVCMCVCCLLSLIRCCCIPHGKTFLLVLAVTVGIYKISNVYIAEWCHMNSPYVAIGMYVVVNDEVMVSFCFLMCYCTWLYWLGLEWLCWPQHARWIYLCYPTTHGKTGSKCKYLLYVAALVASSLYLI